jgi:putative phosphoribosyl transferase
MRFQPHFRDRREAGRQLADLLAGYENMNPIILALPRGGVPVAYEIARVLDTQLDIALVRKLSAPGYPEVGIGAVVDGHDPQIVLNEEIVRMVKPSTSYIQAEVKTQLSELERRRALYRGNRFAPALQGRNVILVDDGIATGGTAKAVLHGLRRSKPASLILAVPVLPADALAVLRPECDEVIYLHAPETFSAVGAYYEDFTQTTDDEVIALLNASRDPNVAARRSIGTGTHNLRQ